MGVGRRGGVWERGVGTKRQGAGAGLLALGQEVRGAGAAAERGGHWQPPALDGLQYTRHAPCSRAPLLRTHRNPPTATRPSCTWTGRCRSSCYTTYWACPPTTSCCASPR